MSSPVLTAADARARLLGLSLLVVLLSAKLAMAAAVVPLSGPWTLIALCWQDVATAMAAAVAFHLARRRWLAIAIYSVLVAYVALNVPVSRVLGSPLTWTMWRAAGGALADSIRYHLTAANLSVLFAFLGIGATAPFVVAKWSRSRTLLLALVIVLPGPLAASRIETLGFDRNALTALMPHVLTHRPTTAGLRPDRTRPEGVAALAAGVALPDLHAYRGSARSMNVILIVLESTAAGYLAPYGATDDPMPTLTAISRQALVADSAYAAYPESVKGLYATLCGQHPRFGLPAEAHAGLPCTSIATSLGADGYRTALFHSGRFNYLGMDALIQGKGFDVAEDAATIGGKRESSFGVTEAATVTRLLGWIDRDSTGAPFFAAYLPAAGHHPYVSATAGPFDNTSEFGRYTNALHDADTALRALLDGLRARTLANRTALVIVGDHGEAFGQHAGNSGHTLFVYDENVRVPFIVSVPGMSERGRRTPAVASLVDVPATIRDLTGIERVDDEGISLLSPIPRLAFFFTDYALGWSGLRDGCLKYIEEVAAGRSKLFDVCQDPGERRDLGPSTPGAAAAYQRRIKTLISD